MLLEFLSLFLEVGGQLVVDIIEKGKNGGELVLLALVQSSSHALPSLGSLLFLIGDILVSNFFQELSQPLNGAILLPVVLPLIVISV